MTRYFIDTEFYENGTTIDLISLGAVCDDGREFYAVSTDARLELVSNWVQENVIAQLPPRDDGRWISRAAMAETFAAFVRPEPGKKRAEIWGYYADYDWVAVAQLYGTMMKLPPHFPMFCLDLKQLSVMRGDPKHPKQKKGEHDALCDARWNQQLYKYLLQFQTVWP